jgi:hypothetical protein
LQKSKTLTMKREEGKNRNHSYPLLIVPNPGCSYPRTENAEDFPRKKGTEDFTLAK